MKTKFLVFLLTLLFPRAPGDDDLDDGPDISLDGVEDTPEDDAQDDDIDAHADDTDDEIESEPEVKKPSRAQQEIIKLRERAQLAEQREQQARREIDEARRQPAQKPADQVLWEQEEAVLNDPKAEDWHKYAVRTAREAREAKSAAAAANNRAADATDKAEFAAIKSLKPKTYEKYADKVEELKRTVWSQVPRKEIMAILVGRDVLEGKVKSAETKPKVNRGSTPGVRSEVARKPGSMTEAQKREKRLEGVLI